MLRYDREYEYRNADARGIGLDAQLWYFAAVKPHIVGGIVLEEAQTFFLAAPQWVQPLPAITIFRSLSSLCVAGIEHGRWLSECYTSHTKGIRIGLKVTRRMLGGVG
jgi:hypothetical protein